jgi:hypothetical protein
MRDLLGCMVEIDRVSFLWLYTTLLYNHIHMFPHSSFTANDSQMVQALLLTISNERM